VQNWNPEIRGLLSFDFWNHERGESRLRYFEDFVVGEKITAGSIRITREEIIEFATRYDPQPFHIDEAAARTSIFGGLTGSSTHTFALSSQIHHQGKDQIALVANLGSENLSFPSPLRPDDEITLTSECIAARVSASRPELGIVTTRGLLINQRGETVMDMTTTFMVMRGPGS
jgi:acyl dehydratase